LLLVGLAGCRTNRPATSIWPPSDFELCVEDLQTKDGVAAVRRRFRVWADGTVVYGRSKEPLTAPGGGVALPVFTEVSSWRMLPEITRQLARKMHKRGILDLEPLQGDQRETGGVALRVRYRAFGQERLAVASGRIHGAMVRLLHGVNAYLPPGETFEMLGMAGDRDPQTQRGIPAAVDDLPGALQFHEEVLAGRSDDRELLLDTFALACKAGRRELASELLTRYRTMTAGEQAATPPSADAAAVGGLPPASGLEVLLPAAGTQ
jgi:hypothetical protein